MGALGKKKISLPFVEGFALQNYSTSEVGIIDAVRNGYQYWYIDGSLPSESPNSWSKERIDNMLCMIEQYKIRPLYHGNFKVPLSSDVDDLRCSAIQYTKKEIDLASELAAPVIVHGGAIVEPRLVTKVKKIALKNYLLSLEDLLYYASNKNVTLYLENLSNYTKYRPFHYIFTKEDEFEFILSATNASFFLDMGHANIGNGSPKAIFERYCRNIVGMSFSNNNGQQDQHLSLTKGTIDYLQVISSIVAKKWKGIIAFETRDSSPARSIVELADMYNVALSASKNCKLNHLSLVEVWLE